MVSKSCAHSMQPRFLTCARYRYHESSPHPDEANPQLPVEYPKKQDNHPQPRTEESETSAETPSPAGPSIPSMATPQDMFSNPPQQDLLLPIPELDAVLTTFSQSEGNFTPFGASGMTALGPNDWIAQSNSNMAFDMGWNSAAYDYWSFDFK
jgi:hypothetical protein